VYLHYTQDLARERIRDRQQQAARARQVKQARRSRRAWRAWTPANVGLPLRSIPSAQRAAGRAGDPADGSRPAGMHTG
jgi:hypothetical protein